MVVLEIDVKIWEKTCKNLHIYTLLTIRMSL